MQSFYAVYRKEMGHYFVSPVAYIFIGVFLFLAAYFFNYFLTVMIQQSFSMEMQGMRFGMPPEIDVPGQVMRGFFGLLSTLVLFFTPILTTPGYVIFICLHSDPMPPWRMVAAGYAGVLLLGGSLIALGTFISSLT